MASEVDFVGILKFAHTSEPEPYCVSYADIFSAALSILVRVINTGINIALIVEYYRIREYNYFIWTILCIVIPIIVTTSFQIAM